ncbi:prolipoprotein diacylglyceryl transferase [Nibricoccus sp. IMCC34717]|uniref:prolipoprotein diacylglyceryl transferase n=1 Tax=Nibricoccus sp. IMCC34717 TaxID=3034021 RepID=UPI0038506F25
MTMLLADAAGHWVHDLDPFLIRFTDTIGIRYYGLSYVLAFVSAAWLLQLYARRGRSPLAAEHVWDFMVAIILGVMIGGRLGSFLLYHPHELFNDPLSLFRVWEGGMASHGGFVGVTIAILWFARHHRLPFFPLADAIVSVAPLGLFFGRVANFINGELWGKPSMVAWAVIFPNADALPRHPSQLYEGLLEGLLLFGYLQVRFWRSATTRLRPGHLSGEFFIGYALVRAVGEQFREPDAALILGLSRGTFYSLFVFAAGVALLVHSRRIPRVAE